MCGMVSVRGDDQFDVLEVWVKKENNFFYYL